MYRLATAIARATRVDPPSVSNDSKEGIWCKLLSSLATSLSSLGPPRCSAREPLAGMSDRSDCGACEAEGRTVRWLDSCALRPVTVRESSRGLENGPLWVLCVLGL